MFGNYPPLCEHGPGFPPAVPTRPAHGRVHNTVSATINFSQRCRDGLIGGDAANTESPSWVTSYEQICKVRLFQTVAVCVTPVEQMDCDNCDTAARPSFFSASFLLSSGGGGNIQHLHCSILQVKRDESKIMISIALNLGNSVNLKSARLGFATYLIQMHLLFICNYQPQT